MRQQARKAIVLDRDGVINEDSSEYIKRADEWKALPGSLDAIAELTRAGYAVFVVSNQSGVNRGLFGLEELARIHRRMGEAVEAAGGELAGIYYCPHRPDEDCSCRKPSPGMLQQLAREHDVALAGMPFVGDKWSDIQAARAVGARPLLVLTGHGAATVAEHGAEIPEVHADLASAVKALLSESAT